MSVFIGLLAGLIGWIIATIVGRPIVEFLKLRSDAARLISFFERPIETNEWGEAVDPTIMERRKSEYQACGSQFLGFANSNATLVDLLQRMKLYPKTAGETLLALSGGQPSSESADQLQRSLISALKLRMQPVGW